MHPNAPQPNFGAYPKIKIANIDLISGDPEFSPLKALQLMVPDLLEANHPVSLIPMFDGDKYLVLAPTLTSKDIIKTLVLKEGKTYVLGRKNLHTGCLRNKKELAMALSLSAVAHIKVHFSSSENINDASQVIKDVSITRLGQTVVRLEDRSEAGNTLVESANLERKDDEGILHPGRGIIHLYAGAENVMTYKLMTLSDYLGSLEEKMDDSPMDITAPLLDLQKIHAQTTELLLSELQKYKLLLAEARAGSSPDGDGMRILGRADEDGSGEEDEDDLLADLGLNLGDHLSLLESTSEDIYAGHRTQAF